MLNALLLAEEILITSGRLVKEIIRVILVPQCMDI